MTSLGGVTLNPSIVWQDRYDYTLVIQEVKHTLDGAPIVYSGVYTSGRPVTLVATAEQGWVEKTVADQIYAMSQQPGAIFSLVIGAETFSVVFRNHDPPAVSLQPLSPRAVPLSGDYFIGSIKLMVI